MLNYTKNLLPSRQYHMWSFNFEENFSFVDSVIWMNTYWSLSLVIVAIYIPAIYFGSVYMRSRPKYNLRKPLFIWNAALTTFYAVGVSRCASEVTAYMRSGGFHSFVCEECPYGCTRVSQFWAWLFMIMKAPELLDSAFVILRKQPLFFLHWYHHSTVLIFTWYLYGHMSSTGLMYALVNAVIHSFMYFYYSLKALSFNVPRPISMALTLIQLSQMVVGFYTNFYVYRAKQDGIECAITDINIATAFLIYSSYFLLFLWYFYKAYIAKKPITTEKLKGQKTE